MKKTSLVLAAALSCIAMSAAATGSHGSQRPQSGPSAGALGVGIAGAQAAATAGAIAANTVGITNTANIGFGVTNTLSGGLGGAGGLGGQGGFGGNATIAAGAMQVAGATTTYKAAASPSFAPQAHGPIKGCRLFVGLGGASTSGSGSAGIPIGNDQACVTDTSHEFMDRANARKPGTFTDDDYLRATCKFEGMSETQACKALIEHETAAAPVGMAYTPN